MVSQKSQVSRETSISRKTINKMLMHEHPPNYGPRRRSYPRLGPYIHKIDQLLLDKDPFLNASKLTIADIVHVLRREEGFAGSYDSVRNYIRRLTQGNETPWGRAYDLVIRLPRQRAIEFLQVLSRRNTPALTSAKVKSFVRDAGRRHRPFAQPSRVRHSCGAEQWTAALRAGEARQLIPFGPPARPPAETGPRYRLTPRPRSDVHFRLGRPSPNGPFRTHGLRFIPKTWVTLLVRRDLQEVRACRSHRRNIPNHNP
jgi:hypothetical protein